MRQLVICGPCGHLLHRYNKWSALRRFRSAATAVAANPEQFSLLLVSSSQDFLLALRQHHAERIRAGTLDPRHAAKPCACEVFDRAEP